VSVGEVKLAAALTREIERELPGYEIAVSCTTAQGMQMGQKAFNGRIVFPTPLDFSWVVRRDYRNLRPCCLVLVELEMWPNLLLEAKRFGVPAVVINCRVSARSFRGYRLLDAFAAGFIPALGVRAFCAQNDVYAQRLRGLGIPQDRVHVTGSMKYDDLRSTVADSRRQSLAKQFGLSSENLVLIAASTHDDEEDQLVEIFPGIAREFPAARLILVPRHVERAEAVANVVSKAGLRPVRKSQMAPDFGELSRAEATTETDPATVIVVDTMGELIDIMSLATVVFVGRSISPRDRGGHNVLEPAALGKPVVFGPFIANFQSEVDLLLTSGAARQVRGKNDLRSVCLELFRSPRLREELGRKAASLIAQNQGATKRNVAILKDILQSQSHFLKRKEAAGNEV
jgi:3-deoxy-D-manno-octulosonic-acid transferase